MFLASDYASLGRAEDAIREANLAIALRPNEATVLYNAACVFCNIGKPAEAITAPRKAWDAGFREATGRAAIPILSRSTATPSSSGSTRPAPPPPSAGGGPMDGNLKREEP